MIANDQFPVDRCLKCSTCNTVCPVYAVEDRFAGPKYIGPELARLASDKSMNYPSVEYCTGCRQCELACPAGVEITLLSQRAKALHSAGNGNSLRDLLLGHNQTVSKLASKFTPLTNLVLQTKVAGALASNTVGLANRPFPRYNTEFKYHSSGPKQARAKVVYFIGCYARYIGTGTAKAVVKILRACGIEVIVPTQKCCGVPLLSNGLKETARKNAQFNTEVLSKYIDQGYVVITSCPSCALSLKQEYVRHFDLPEAAKLAGAVKDISQFLVDLENKGGPRLEFGPVEKRFFYHQSCHTKAQGIGNPSAELVKLIPGLELATREQKCCGQAGTYGFKKEKYEISRRIGEKLFLDVEECAVDAIITDCGACGMQLAQGTGKNVYHPMEILCDALKNHNGCVVP